MRWVPLSAVLLLPSLGCSEVGSPAIAVTFEERELTSDHETPIDFGRGRRYGPEPTIALQVENPASVALTIDEIRTPAGVHLVAEALPLQVEPGATKTIELVLSTATARRLAGYVTIESDDPYLEAFRIPVEGLVEPYIRQRLETHPELDSYLERIVREETVVGLGAAVVRGQDIVYLVGLGDEDRARGVAVDPNATLFRWGSLSKGLGAVAALTAEREGTWDLDDDVERYLPEYRVPDRYLPRGCRRESCTRPLPLASRHITLRALLTHTAGIEHYGNGVESPVPPIATRDNRRGEFAYAIGFWSDHPLVAIPSERFSYSTFGYNLMGAALERATGEDYATLIDSQIAERLEMRSLSPDLGDRPRRAEGYRRQRDGTVGLDFDHDVTYKLPGGGFLSTPADLARWCGGLMGNVLLTPRQRDEQLFARQPNTQDYGLGFFLETNTVHHTGGQRKTRTGLRIRLDQNLCFVVMTNSTWVDPHLVVEDMAKRFED